MKYLLITPSNTFHMPYLNNYIQYFKDQQIDYDLIIWDRMGRAEADNSPFIYRDHKKDINRSLIDYLKYAQYVRKIMATHHYDRVVCFSLQLLFVLQLDLIRLYKNKFLVDIRDLHPVQHLLNLGYLSKNSLSFVLSSKGFLDNLQGIEHYIINHNTNVYQQKMIKSQPQQVLNKNTLKISCIGSLKEYQENIKLIKHLKNKPHFQLHYNGFGPETENLKDYVSNQKLKNVFVTGEYQKEVEEELYLESDMVNILLNPQDKNNRLCLPNRLYKAAQYGKPILSNKGLYFNHYVKKYQLGLVIDSIDNLANIEKQIKDYYSNLDFLLFDKNRQAFIKEIEADNQAFYQLLAGVNNQKEAAYSL